MDKKETYNIYGMTCSNCALHVRKAVEKLDGIKEVNVNLITNSMSITADDSLSSTLVCNAVKNAGYKAKLIGNNIKKEDTEEDSETVKLKNILFASIILMIPLFYLSMGFMIDWPIGYFSKNPLMLGLVEFLISLTIIIINNRFFINGFKTILKLSPTMDSLVALGSGVSFIYSTILLFMMTFYATNSDFHQVHTYAMNLCFETAGMVPTFITIGKTLESYTKGKTTSAIKSLMDLSPKMIHIISGKDIIDIEVSKAKIGDKFIVKPGEGIPLDGKIISGITSVDEKLLTGESLPIDKEINDLVFAGTININGSITCIVEKVVDETILNQMIKLVKEASSTKTKTSELVDKISFYFIPTIISISIIVFIFWLILGNNFVSDNITDTTTLTYAIEKGVSVLVISCPCALGLATPVAIMAGNGVSARNGILFKNATAMEETGKCKYIVLDKTGTLTKGLPFVQDIIPFNSKSKDELLSICYSLENSSNHPLAKSISTYAKENKIKLHDVKELVEISGKGIKAKIDDELYYAGNLKLLDESKISYDLEKNKINEILNQGKQIIIVFNNKRVIGLISFADEIKEDTVKSILWLKKMGLTPIILSGDNKKVVENIASVCGVEKYYAEVLPSQKLDVIKSLQTEGKVIMVGDGINDAPSLQQADVGIALKTGSEIALDSGNVVLMSGSLLEVNYAINISRQTFKNIKENLFWAFIYNLIMIPIASGVFSPLGLTKLKPWMGSLAMSLSSICVCLNALRLNLFNFKNENVNIPKKIKESNKVETDSNLEELLIPDMMCDKCVSRITSALKSIKGLSNIKVSLKDKKAYYNNNGVNSDIIIKKINNIGYKVENVNK